MDSVAGPSSPPRVQSSHESLRSDAPITLEILNATLSSLDDQPALELCQSLLVSSRVHDVALARGIIELGQGRVQHVLQELRGQVDEALRPGDEVSQQAVSSKATELDWNAEATRKALDRVLEKQGDRLTDTLRSFVALEKLRRKVETFQVLSPSAISISDNALAGPSTVTAQAQDAGMEIVDTLLQTDDDDAVEDIDLDDPWAEAEDTDGARASSDRSANVDGGNPETETIIVDPWETGSATSEISEKKRGKSPMRSRSGSQSSDSEMDEDLPFDLDTFLSQPLVNSAVSLAQGDMLRSLSILLDRHGTDLWSWRFVILDALPPFTNPLDIQDTLTILPHLGSDGEEAHPAKPPMENLTDVLSIKDDLQASIVLDGSMVGQPEAGRLTVEQLSQWYLDKVETLDSYGLIDIQLAWVQHGASQGLPNLDALGEDLSLLSKLAYDAELDPSSDVEWNLESWRSSSEEDIVNAYLSGSTSDSVVSHIRRLVLPYLYVLESRAERAGKADPNLIDRYLHDALLQLPLQLALSVFEASKATLPSNERLIKNDLVVARLALACLYGSTDQSKNVWSIMSAIFECLPVWDITTNSDNRDADDDNQLTSTTLDSIAAFVRPGKVGDPPPTPKDLFIFFSPLPFASLSRALDILDVHLESGEILSRWDTPVQLRFLLQSAGHHQDQLDLAEKMMKRQSKRGQGYGQVQQTEKKWIDLWSDMIKLNRGQDSSLRGAFGMLTIQEMMRIYLGGLLGSGNFDVARKMVRRLETEHGLEKSAVEQVALSTSMEFYDNAESGNIHIGDMKLAYDCLSVPPSSPAIVTQRDFIEATSRLSTFSIPSPLGTGTITPLEIRHSKSKLELIRQVLHTSSDAFQHPDLILDLVGKLGYKGNTDARIEVLGMLVESAVKAGEYDVAYSHCQDMVHLSKKKGGKRSSHGTDPVNSPVKVDPKDVVWKSCFLIGSQKDFSEVDKRMTLLGQAVEFCPPDEIPSILDVWRKVEEGRMKLDEAAKRRRITGIRASSTYINGQQGSNSTSGSRIGSSLTSPIMGMGLGLSGGEERMLGSRTAARAARLAMDFAGDRLKFSSGGISPQLSFSPRSPSVAGSDSGAAPSTRGEGSTGAAGTAGTAGAVGGVAGLWRTDSRRSNDSDRPSLGSILDGAGLAHAGQGAAEEAERVRQQARRALVRGVGWLLGADESEIGAGS